MKTEVTLDTKKVSAYAVRFPESFDIHEWSVGKVLLPHWEDGEWQDMPFVFNDIVSPSSSLGVYRIIECIIAYEDIISPIFDIQIEILDDVGTPTERWTIGVKEVKSINFGNGDYDSTDIHQISMLIKPAYCRLEPVVTTIEMPAIKPKNKK